MTHGSRKSPDKAGRPHVKAVRLTDQQQDALTRLRGPQSETDFLRAVIEPVLGGLAPTPLALSVEAIVRHMNRLAVLAIAYHSDLEVDEAERIVSEFLSADGPAEGRATP